MEKFLEEYSKILDETGGHLSFQALATYHNLIEKLSGKEKIFIEKHLKICTACKEKYKTVLEEDIELDNILGENEIIRSKTSSTRIFSIMRYWKYAAAAVIVIGLLTALYFSFISNEEEIIADRTTKPEKLEQNEESLTESQLKKPEPEKKSEEENIPDSEISGTFAVNIVLENFIDRNIRSEKTIEIISPEIGADVSSTITFEWRRINSTGSLLLTVVDNKNNPVYEMTVGGSTLAIDKKLKAGLYYWKLQSGGKLETVGKFFVRK